MKVYVVVVALVLALGSCTEDGASAADIRKADRQTAEGVGKRLAVKMEKRGDLDPDVMAAFVTKSCVTVAKGLEEDEGSARHARIAEWCVDAFMDEYN